MCNSFHWPGVWIEIRAIVLLLLARNPIYPLKGRNV